MIGQAMVNAAGCICEANDAFARFSRYTAQQLNGLPLTALLHPDSPPPVPGRQNLIQLRAADGQPLWGSAYVLPLQEDAGFVLQVYDRTRDQIEHQLHKGRAQVLELLYREKSLEEICEAIVHQIETLGEGMRCSILVLDKERGTLHKAAAPNLPDFYSEAIEGMRIGDGVGSCGTAVFRRERVIVSDILNHPYWQRARRLVSRTPMRACWSEPIIAHDGEVLGSFAIYYDTPREPLCVELDLISSAASLAAIAIAYKKSQQALRDLDRAKDEFISIASHELRTPMTAIMGYAESLLEVDDTSPTIREYAQEITQSCEALVRLVDDLLDVSLIQIGRGLTINRQPVAIVSMLERVIAFFRRRSGNRLIELRCDADLPETVSCDKGRITQVLENLVGNAVKYSGPHSTISITVERCQETLRFNVSDQGIGMSDEVVRRAFDKFYRADASLSSPPGLGMGLCIARKIVEIHGGEMSLKSIQGEGTTISFTLPLHNGID
jgi:signal transduction histidine kinase